MANWLRSETYLSLAFAGDRLPLSVLSGCLSFFYLSLSLSPSILLSLSLYLSTFLSLFFAYNCFEIKSSLSLCSQAE